MTLFVRRALSSVATTTRVSAEQPHESLAVIAPQLLKLVSGGAPKGGWMSEPLPTADIEGPAPKGGWA
jgi:hypothetical protein